MPPEPTSQSVFETVSMFAKRSNAIIYHIDVPWKDLLTSNQTATDLLMRDQAPLIVYMRNSFNVSLFVTLDLTDGLDRAKVVLFCFVGVKSSTLFFPTGSESVD